MAVEACLLSIVIGLVLLLLGLGGRTKITLPGMVISSSLGGALIVLGVLCYMGVGLFG